MAEKDDSGMSSTSQTLLQRMQAQDSGAWEEFLALYGPMIYGWLRRFGARPDAACDLAQDVYRSVHGAIPRFERQRTGSFRRWLRTICRNKCSDQKRQAEPVGLGGHDSQKLFDEIVSPDLDGDPYADNSQTTASLSRRALEMIRGNFKPKQWEAFWNTVIEERDVATVAKELEMTPSAIYKARSRVLKRLREKIDDWLA